MLPLAPEAVAAMRAHTLGGRVWRTRVTAQIPGEMPRHWDLTAMAVRDECDGIAEAAIAIRDVTAEVRAEQRLRASEARFRALVQRSADAALIADAHGRLTYASPALREVFGYEPWEVEGINGFEFVHPDDLEKAATLLSDVLEQPGPQPAVELRLRAADGQFIWTEETVSNQLHNPDIGGIVINLRHQRPQDCGRLTRGQ